MYGAQENDSFSFVRCVAHHGHVIFESSSELYLLFVLEDWSIIVIPGLFLGVSTTVESSASSFSAMGMHVKKLSIAISGRIKNKVMLINNCEFNILLY